MQTSILLLLSALALGVTGTQLIYPSLSTLFTNHLEPGLGLSAWFILNFLTYTIFVLRYRKQDSKALFYLLPATVSATTFCLRDSTTLKMLDLLTVFTNVAICLGAVLKEDRFTTGSIGEYFQSFQYYFFAPLVGTADLLAHDITWNRACPDSLRPHIKGLFRGAAMATPLLIIFSALFISADPAFAAMSKSIFHFDPGTAARDTLTTLILAATSAGGMRQLVILANASFQGEECGADGTKTIVAEAQKRPPLNIGITEIGTALALINVLFASFVTIQLGYLFGGEKLVKLTPGLSYAEYARHGFFELCTVAALAIPMLLFADAVRDKTGRKAELTFRFLAGILISLLSVIMVSAVERMHLYTIEYGLSELRLNVLAFMGWLGAICVIFSLTVLTGNRKRFAFASYAAGLISIYGMHLANPDALIETTNIALAKQGKTLDTQYLTSLSADSVPPLLERLGDLSPAQKKEIAAKLLTEKERKVDVRDFNFSRYQAKVAIQKHRVELEQALKEGI